MILREMFRESEPVFTVSPDGRICEAAELMRQRHIGSVVVVEDENVVGIITDRDIALALALGAATSDSFVSEVMTREVRTVWDSISLYELTRRFRDARVKRFPVVDDDNHLVGIVTSDDVIALLAREMFDTCKVLEPKLGHMV